MNTEPIYELRERLRAAAMAGTSLLSEDFRLKRACEAFRPLEKASPVFAKVGQLAAKLTEPDCQDPQGALLDAITLVDAVICTLGTVDVAGEIEYAEVLNTEENMGSLIVNAPYSTLKELLEALTTSGSGHYGTVCDTHDHHPELFRDYRVKHTLVQALGASYSELAEDVEHWLIEDDDKTILPALYKDFDPKGKKEMVRRVRVIGALAGADANDFYIKMLGEAQKDVRTELIKALRYEPSNVSLLLDLSKTEKGKNKDKVYEMLAAVQDERVKDFYRELAKKKPDNALKYLRNTTAEWAAELVADLSDDLVAKLDTAASVPEKEKQELLGRLRSVVRALFGKGGTRICECYWNLLAQKEKINALLRETWKEPKNSYEKDVLQYGALMPPQFWYKTKGMDIEASLGKFLHHSVIVNPDPALQALALELYQNGNSGKTNAKFLSAAATVKLSGDENCVDWLERQTTEKVLLISKRSGERLMAVIEAVNYIMWDRKENRYHLYGSYVDCDPEDLHAGRWNGLVYEDDFYSDYGNVERNIELPHAKELIGWLIRQEASQQLEKVLAQLAPANDEALCREIGEYFYQRILNASNNDRNRLVNYLKLCGWKDCRGLGVNVVKKDPGITMWNLYGWLISLPGSKEAIMEEMRTVCRMIKSGELKVKKLNTEELEGYMDRWYMA